MRLIGLFLYLAFGLLGAGAARAQFADSTVRQNIWRITVVGTRPGATGTVLQTGFVVRNGPHPGIHTALHGVLGEVRISAVNDYWPEVVFRNLKVQKVDILRDVALLHSPDLERFLQRHRSLGLVAVTGPRDVRKWSRVACLGYPEGEGFNPSNCTIGEPALDKLSRKLPLLRSSLSKRASPSDTVQIVWLSQGSLCPGYSGAPVLEFTQDVEARTKPPRVLGLVDGGLKLFSGHYWAIPIYDARWQSADLPEVKSRLAQLAAMDHSLLFSYNTPLEKLASFNPGRLSITTSAIGLDIYLNRSNKLLNQTFTLRSLGLLYHPRWFAHSPIGDKYALGLQIETTARPVSVRFVSRDGSSAFFQNTIGLFNATLLARGYWYPYYAVNVYNPFIQINGGLVQQTYNGIINESDPEIKTPSRFTQEYPDKTSFYLTLTGGVRRNLNRWLSLEPALTYRRFDVFQANLTFNPFNNARRSATVTPQRELMLSLNATVNLNLHE